MSGNRLKLALLISITALLVPGLASADYEAEQVVVNLQPGRTIDEVNATWGTSTLDAYPEGNLYLLNAAGLGDAEQLATQMALDPAILEAEANYIEKTPETIRQMVVVIVGGGLVEYEDQTIGTRIGLDQAHLMSLGGGTMVAIIDTGVDPTHEVFQGKLSPLGRDFVDNDDSPWESANGIDDDLDLQIDEGYGHGTMVAGIVSLVAPEATLLPVRVLSDEGHGDSYRIAKGIRYATNQGADVLNMSFGIPHGISIISHQLAYARSIGVVIVAGAGNESKEQAYFPAAAEVAEMVTAVDSLDVKAGFADWDSKVLVSAPGTGVRSPFPGGGWAMGAGCSFATPFVSGEAALILSLDPAASPDDVRVRLMSAVTPIDAIPDNDPYQGKLGSGRIFVPDALAGLPASIAEGGVSVSEILPVPNPSTGEVRLVALDPGGQLSARIFDATGRLVRTLSPSRLPTWDGMDGTSRAVETGVYFVLVDGRDRRLSTRVQIVR